MPRVAINLYIQCCQHYGIKPNKDVSDQIHTINPLRVTEIDASRTFLGALGIHALLDFCQHHRCLTKLKVPSNGLDVTCIEHLCYVLAGGHPSLSYIDISKNALPTPAARALWEVAKSTSTLKHIDFSDCGFSDEWAERIRRVLETNREFQLKGFYSNGPPRVPGTWSTVFIMVVGSDAYAHQYCSDVVSVVGSYMVPMRVRIAPLLIRGDDAPEVLYKKMSQCRDTANRNLTWCAILFSNEKPSNAHKLVIESMEKESIPVVPPLKDKLGVTREKIYRPAPSQFVYYCTRDESLPLSMGATVDSTSWAVQFPDDALSTMTPKAVILTPTSFKLRAQSDLFHSLMTVYSESEAPLEEEVSPASKGPAVQKASATRHTKIVTDVIRHIMRPSEVCLPFLLYGASGIGKSTILNDVEAELRMQNIRVYRHSILKSSTSIIIFFYEVLLFLDPNASLVYPSVQYLLNAVNNAIQSYKGDTAVILVPRWNHLDACGLSGDILIKWIPESLNQSVKMVLSVDTESSLLTKMRERIPQPYEQNIPYLSDVDKIALFQDNLRIRGITLPGLGSLSSIGSSGEKLSTIGKMYADKKDSSYGVFSVLAASVVVAALEKKEELNECDAGEILSRFIPDTIPELIDYVCRLVEDIHGSQIVESILLSLCASPLSLPDLAYVCEEMADCRKYSSLPAVLQLLDLRLVTLSPEGYAFIRNAAIRDEVRRRYSENQDRFAVLVELQLERLVSSRTSELGFAFRSLPTLIVSNGNIQAAIRILLDTSIMDSAISADPMNRFYAIDGILRLIQALHLVREVREGSPDSSFLPSIENLQRALAEIQCLSTDLYQSSLLATHASPFISNALSQSFACAPYTVLYPSNQGGEDTSVATVSVPEKCLHVAVNSEYFVATLERSVYVYQCDTQKEVEKLLIPFENSEKILGSLLCIGNRVAIVGTSQLVIWDFIGKNTTLLEDFSAVVEDRALDICGARIVGVHPSDSKVSVADVTRKKNVNTLKKVDGTAFKAIFCGSDILIATLFDVYIVGKETQSVLHHNSAILSVTSSVDGKMVATSIDYQICLWLSKGELLHIIKNGATPVYSMQFSSGGNLLLSRQPEGSVIWKTSSGTKMRELDQPLTPSWHDLTCVTFTEDNSKVLGTCGRFLYIWDAVTGVYLGAIRSPSTYFYTVHEANNVLYLPLNEGDIKLWFLNGSKVPYNQVRDKPLSTNWLRNSRVSLSAIASVSISSDGSCATAITAEGKLLRCSLENGTCTPIAPHEAIAVAAAYKNEVAYIYCRDSSVHLLNANGTEARSLSLPKAAAVDSQFRLFKSEDEKILAITSFADGYSHLFLVSVPSLTLNDHFSDFKGHILLVSIFEGFAFSVDERVIRLWNLAKHVERTYAVHSERWVAAVTTNSDTLIVVDEKQDLYRVHVENITSKNATVVLEKLTRLEFLPVGMWYSQQTLFFLKSDGTMLSLESRNIRRKSHKIALDKCRCAAICHSPSKLFITGHENGEVVINRIINPI